MRIEVLGCSAVMGPGLDTTSFLLNEDTLIDAGSGAGRLDLKRALRIRRVFLSHSHLDHLLGLPTLLLNILGKISEPIALYGLPETLDALKTHIFNWSIWPDFSVLPSPESPTFDYRPLRPGHRCDFDGIGIEVLPVNHIVPAVGYRVESSAGVWAFTGDTAINDDFWRALNDGDRLDLLFAECAFSDGDRELARLSKHYCPSTLTADLTKLRHRPELCLSHLQYGSEDLILRQCRNLMQNLSPRRLEAGRVFEF